MVWLNWVPASDRKHSEEKSRSRGELQDGEGDGEQRHGQSAALCSSQPTAGGHVCVYALLCVTAAQIPPTDQHPATQKTFCLLNRRTEANYARRQQTGHVRRECTHTSSFHIPTTARLTKDFQFKRQLFMFKWIWVTTSLMVLQWSFKNLKPVINTSLDLQN